MYCYKLDESLIDQKVDTQLETAKQILRKRAEELNRKLMSDSLSSDDEEDLEFEHKAAKETIQQLNDTGNIQEMKDNMVKKDDEPVLSFLHFEMKRLVLPYNVYFPIPDEERRYASVKSQLLGHVKRELERTQLNLVKKNDSETVSKRPLEDEDEHGSYKNVVQRIKKMSKSDRNNLVNVILGVN